MSSINRPIPRVWVVSTARSDASDTGARFINEPRTPRLYWIATTLCVLLLAATACPALEAGAATIEITPQPPLGVPMSGYGGDTYDHRSQATHDPLHARVLVLDDGRSRTALITLDLIGLNQGDLPTRLRELGIGNWVLASSHTHGGPKVLSLLEPFAEDRTWPVDDPYVTWLENRIAEGTARALERMQPATLSVAKGSVDISFNRRLVHTDGTVEMIWGANRARRYTGPTDPEVGVVRVDDRAGNPLAILLNYACHPVVLGSGNRQLTADYPGYACAYLERRFPGTVALFLQGADGDLDPYIDVQNDFAPAQDQGEELGREVERVVRALDPYREGQPHALELHPLIEVTHYQYTFAGFYDRSQSIETPFSLLRIGDRLAFVNLPGEPFVELQLDLKARSPLPFTFLIGYANGYAGYFPTLKANREGGYGANSGGTMHLEAAAGEVMVARALEELTASFWEQPLPKVVVGGSVTRLLTVVRPPLLQADAPISVTVDLSQLGGSAEEELTPTEDGRFSLDVEFPLTAPAGRHEIWFTVVQQISTGPHVTRVAQTLSVLPGSDLLPLKGELASGWQLETSPAVNAEEIGIFDGLAARAFQVDSAAMAAWASTWSIDLTRQEPFSLSGYGSLRLQFHAGTLVAPREPWLALYLGERRIDLRGKIDLENPDWQTVELPLDPTAQETPIKQIRLWGNLSGRFFLGELRLVSAFSPTTAAPVPATAPQSFRLLPAYPNPFNGTTTIPFDLPSSVEVNLTLYNLTGQRVITLARGMREAGGYSIGWDGMDDAGRALVSGMYFYNLTAGDRSETRKLILLR